MPKSYSDILKKALDERPKFKEEPEEKTDLCFKSGEELRNFMLGGFQRTHEEQKKHDVETQKEYDNLKYKGD